MHVENHTHGGVRGLKHTLSIYAKSGFMWHNKSKFLDIHQNQLFIIEKKKDTKNRP